MIVHAYQGITPTLSPGVRAAETAALTGDVTLGTHVNLWHGCALRADAAPITVGANTNIQENVVIHEDPGHPVTIGRNVTVGHSAVIHGCTVEDGCLIGMGAILLNGCTIGKGSLVAAGALVLQNQVIPPASLVVGSPCRILRPLTGDELAANLASAAHYVELAEGSLPLAEEGEG